MPISKAERYERHCLISSYCCAVCWHALRAAAAAQ